MAYGRRKRGYSSRADFEARSPRAQQRRVDYGAGKPQTGQPSSFASGQAVRNASPVVRRETPLPQRTQAPPSQAAQPAQENWRRRYDQPGNLRNWVAESTAAQQAARPYRRKRHRELRGLSPKERVRRQREYWSQRRRPDALAPLPPDPWGPDSLPPDQVTAGGRFPPLELGPLPLGPLPGLGPLPYSEENDPYLNDPRNPYPGGLTLVG